MKERTKTTTKTYLFILNVHFCSVSLSILEILVDKTSESDVEAVIDRCNL